MNLCIVTSSFPSHPGDHLQAPFILPFIDGLRRRGHRVFVFTQDRPGEKAGFPEGVQVRWFPWLESSKPLVQLNPLRPWDALRIGSLFHHGKKALPSFVKESRIDACLALWVLPGGYFAYHAHRQTGTPYSVWALGSDIYRYGSHALVAPVMKRIVSEARGVFADGFDLSKRVEQRFGRKCAFLATARKLLEVEDQQEHGNRPCRFLFVGRVEKVKGVDVLLKALELLVKEEPSVHLTVVGKGALEGWVRGFIAGRRMEEHAVLLGQVPDEELARAYAASDCVVIPSRSESIPLVFSEALRFNKALVVTDVGDMGTLGQTYGVASVVAPGDPVALKEAMKERARSRDPEKGTIGGRRGELLKLFDIETSVERFLADYL